MEEKNRVFAHLKAIGFEQRSKSLFRRGDIEIKLLDDALVLVSFFDPKTGLDFSVQADLNTSDLSTISAD